MNCCQFLEEQLAYPYGNIITYWKIHNGLKSTTLFQISFGVVSVVWSASFSNTSQFTISVHKDQSVRYINDNFIPPPWRGGGDAFQLMLFQYRYFGAASVHTKKVLKQGFQSVHHIASSQIFTYMFMITASWNVTPCGLVDRYQRLGGMCCLHFHEHGSSRFLQMYMASHSRRQ
jgi:hypothetical protein